MYTALQFDMSCKPAYVENSLWRWAAVVQLPIPEDDAIDSGQSTIVSIYFHQNSIVSRIGIREISR
jgi:hypothetical protein